MFLPASVFLGSFFTPVIHYHSLDNITFQDTWLTIGIFDGVHLGHRALLQCLVDGADRKSVV
jgi:FAD synthase